MTAPNFAMHSLANPTGIPMTLEDVITTRCRPAWLRTDLPRVGQEVQYRHDEYGPLVDATILLVEMENRRDPCVWRYVLDEAGRPVVLAGVRIMEMVDDPWPSVRLQTVHNLTVDTREARFPGSPGWLPRSVKE